MDLNAAFEVNLKKTLYEYCRKKQALMHFIEEADEKLIGLLLAIATEYNDADVNYTKEELEFFEARRDEFFSNGKKGYSVEESMENIHRNYNSEV